MRRCNSFFQNKIFFLMVMVLWMTCYHTTICFGEAPSYEMQTIPANGGTIVERQPILQWLVFPNGNQISESSLLLDDQNVPLQQVAIGNAVKLMYQPTVDLKPGTHTMEYRLKIVGFRPLVLSSSFVIVEKGPDLYRGKDEQKLAVMENEALVVLNTYRQSLGLTSLLKNKKLSMSAQAHANYLTLNHLQSHYEREATAGFTGIRPQNRGEFFGYPGLIGEGISFTPPIASTGIDELMDAPYHRLGHINPNYREAGIAFGWRPESTVVNYGMTGSSTDDRVMLYPYPGQTDAKIAWFVAEEPNPLARYGQDKVTVGYPISLSMYDYNTIEFQTLSATLTDDSGRSVPFYLVDSTLETEQKCHVFLIPVQPLAAGKTYTVSVGGMRVQKDGRTIPLKRTWSFSTLAELKVRHIGMLTLGNGEYIQVITQNGDLSDLNYTLSKDGNKIRSYVGQEKKYYAYDQPVLQNGEYTLEISSASFLQKLTYKVVVSGIGEERQVNIVNGKEQIPNR